MVNTPPTKLRKAKAADGHRCSCTLEVEVDNWLHAQRIPHKKPKVAKKGQYYTKSRGVPNFVVIHPSPEEKKVHSIIELKGVPRPKKVQEVIHIPEVKPKYRRLVLTEKELMDPGWREKGHKFYSRLRKEIIRWAKKEGIKLRDLRKDFKNNSKNIDPPHSQKK